MTWHQIERNCRQFAGDIKDWWGHLTDHEWAPTVIDKTILAPLRLVHVAKWISKARTAVALDAEGKIVVFHDKKLAFPKRQASWRYFASETIVTPLAGRAPVKVSIQQVREAMRGTSLGGNAPATKDARHVGTTQQDGHPTDAGGVAEDVALASCPSRKIARLRRALGHKPYPHDLDTALRQEIEALDGATVLTLDGEVLAARAILLIRNGHSGNGPRNTEKEYDSNIRIKMNYDGYLQVFASENDGPLVSFG